MKQSWLSCCTSSPYNAATDQDGRTPLMTVVSRDGMLGNEKLAVVEMLLEMNANIKAHDNVGGG